MEDTRKDLLADLGLSSEAHFVGLDAFVKGDHKYIRDLRVNLRSTLESASLGGKKNAYLIALAVAANDRNNALISAFTELAKKEGATEAEIAETHAIASLLATNNVFYRFRHFCDNKAYEQMPAGIKMTIMLRPVLPKVFFELISLVVSAVNGCQACVNSHEKSVRHEGGSEQMIFDAIRLGAVVRGLSISMNECHPVSV
ncbi:MAG: carboxymuconolactone decarboxylase family protein [Chloroherpetonaceae bacterium]|nr:carboxymuconolactone decarboxylase family protein [Chloroherpetonaceae bacterium]MDW8437498.1 carboxymuconolactone decarboxylase family protein [Chloroherpetonaceae bacterium]